MLPFRKIVMILCSFASSSPAFATDSPLDLIDCAPLKIDFVRMMPEMVEPKPFVAPDPPFTPENLKQFESSERIDPNGLCQYRDANRSLPPATFDRVVFFGDSITEYWQLGDNELFTGDVIDRGVSAQNTSQMLLRFQHDVIALNPRTVHILAGINDAMHSNGTLLTRQNVVSMVELAKAHGIDVVLGSLTPADGFWLVPDAKLAPFVAQHNAWLRTYAAREKITFVDYFAALAGPDGKIKPEWTNDGLHPNRLGYANMAPLVRQAIKAKAKLSKRD
jgi:lysophospholipase L1-like esterase